MYLAYTYSPTAKFSFNGQISKEKNTQINQTKHIVFCLKYKPHAFYIFTDSGLYQQYSELRVTPSFGISNAVLVIYMC